MRIITVTSGKGGVGKTTSSASIGYGLAQRGKKVCVIDFDVGLRNLDLITGLENRVVYDLINVINGEASVNQALIKDKRDKEVTGFHIIAASQTRDKDALTIDGIKNVLDELRLLEFDFVLCDSPAGIEKGAMCALYFADEAIVTSNPEISSVRDSDRIIGMLDSKTKRSEDKLEPVKEHLLITRYNPDRVTKGELLSLEDMKDILGDLDIIGVIPDSDQVVSASNTGNPVIMGDGDAANAYKDVVSRLLGEEVPLRFTDAKKGFMQRLFRQ